MGGVLLCSPPTTLTIQRKLDHRNTFSVKMGLNTGDKTNGGLSARQGAGHQSITGQGEDEKPLRTAAN